MRPLRPFAALQPFRTQWNAVFGALSPERTPEIEFVTADDQLFFTADAEQLVVQET